MDKNSFPFIIFEASLAWRNELDKRLKPLGLSQIKWRILAHLSLSSEPLKQMDLADLLGFEGPMVIGLLDRLAKDDWVKRLDDPVDRRGNLVQLTPKALLTIKTIHSTADAFCEEVLATLSKDKVKVCMEVLQFIKTRLEAMP